MEQQPRFYSLKQKNGLRSAIVAALVSMEKGLAEGNDWEPYLERVEYMRNHLGLNIQAAGVDSAYRTGLICQAMEDRGIYLYTPGEIGGGGPAPLIRQWH